MTFEIVEDCMKKKIDGLFCDQMVKKRKKTTYNMRNFMHVRCKHIFICDEYLSFFIISYDYVYCLDVISCYILMQFFLQIEFDLFITR